VSAACSKYGRYEESSKTSVEKSEYKTTFERSRHSYEIILKLVEPNIHMAREGLDWIDLDQNRGQEGILFTKGIS
jgi:hypothetical protein